MIRKFFDHRIIRYGELVNVPVGECGDYFVNLNTALKNSGRKNLRIEIASLKYPLARSGAFNRLKYAGQLLGAEYQECVLRVLYAYRPMSIQTNLFAEQLARIKANRLDLQSDNLLEAAHLFIAVPEVAGHPTGGAFDVTITSNGKPLDMGCKYPDFDSPCIQTFCSGLTRIQKRNRMLLRRVLLASGFAPFNGEWWHFSYGDREWAAFYGKPAAIYSQVELYLVQEFNKFRQI